MNRLSDLDQHLQHLTAEQRWEEALGSIGSHRAQFGNSAELEYRVAGIYGAQRNFGASEQHCREAIVLNADYADAWFRLGNALDAQERRVDALPCFDRALQLAPHHAHAWNNRGACYLALQQYIFAERDFEHAVDLEPDLTAFQTNLLLARIYLGQTHEILRDLERVIAPLETSDRSYVCTLLGIAFLKAGAAANAEILYRRVLEWVPRNASGQVNLGLALLAQARFQDAQQAFESARALEPDHVEAAWSLGCLSLLLVDYPRGWPLYEYRWRRLRHARNYDFPEWDGVTSLTGKTLLLYCEQGYGDNIQFARFIPQLKTQGARLLLSCPAALAGLFAIFEIEQVSGANLPAEIHFQCALGSLPHHLQISTDQLRLQQPYLRVPDIAKQRWIKHFHGLDSTKRNIGFVWSGNPKHVNDANRSVPLHHFAEAFKLPGIRWFSLQKGPLAANACEFLAQAGIQALGDSCVNFADTAGIIAELDLVISVDTSVAHLTGALGRPGWVLLPYVPDWRWGLEQDSSPWYPELRLFRQSARKDWREVMERVVVSLVELNLSH